MFIILIVLTLIGAIVLALILFLNNDKSAKAEVPTIDEILEQSVDIPEITTNLLDGRFVVIQFKVQTDSKKTKEELEKRSFQVKNIIIQEVSEMTAKEFQGRAGKEDLEKLLKLRINELMSEGTVEKVYITSFILQ
ncbi:flagellar basal body-associated protein FliL [Bacillus sp. HMF5848]|uniref:flagellar basal body-associated protein FliL n=1 Tax=Bacillus sp. HMF5848 TaxID=2495421 RepID=UPI0021AD5333|nr:flagellar basal body-associated protein FliL [Bacillus sp. HMF5848]